MYKKILFKTMLLLCALVAGSGSVWADDVVAYTLTPASGSNNGYANNCDITIGGITWNLTGNSTVQPWRIGGKSLNGVDRALYSKTAISDNITKIEVTHGAASSITVNSWTVYVSKNSDFSNLVSTLTPTFEANATTTITRPDGVDWNNCYFKFVYNVTVSGNSNKFIAFSEAKFYKESGSSAPVQLDAPTLTATASNNEVSLEWDAISNASSYTIQYADNDAFTGATTIDNATSPKVISGLTNGTTYYFKAMTVGDGTNYLSSDYGTVVSATPANVSKITITQDDLTDFTNTYAWYDWSAGGVSGQAYAYKNSGMQFNSSKDAYCIYNSTAIPGIITSVKMVKASGTDRSWTLRAGTSEISSINDGTQIGEAQTVGTDGATWSVDGAYNYNYFLLYVSGGSTVISSIEITYIPSTDPIIVASDPAELTYNAAGGEFGYSITNPTNATLNAVSNAAWITNVAVENSKVTFSTSTNTGDQRQGTITLSYTGATDKVITITQAAAPQPSINADNVEIAYGATSGSIAYTLENATGNVTAAVTNGDWLTLGTVTASEVPFTCSANTSATARTATVTLSFTGATDKVVTVTQAAYAVNPTLTFDFTDTAWGFPSDYTTTEEDYENGGYTFTFGASSNGHKKMVSSGNQTGVIFGKQDATLIFPAFDFNVNKIMVYGISGASGKVTFNIYDGDDAVSDEVTGSTTTHTFDIDSNHQNAGTIYTLKLTNDNNCQISKIEVFGYATVTINSLCTDGNGTYYGTYSNTHAFIIPDGLTVEEVGINNNGKLNVQPYTGDIVPANTGVLISSTTAGEKTLTLTTGGTSVLGNDNRLRATGAGIDATAMSTADANCLYYRLTMHNGTTLGFWWGADGGAAFDVAANKAYLAVPNGNGAKMGFTFGADGEATAIETINNNQYSNNRCYNLNGQQVSGNYKGIVIVNGKKVMNK